MMRERVPNNIFRPSISFKFLPLTFGPFVYGVAADYFLHCFVMKVSTN